MRHFTTSTGETLGTLFAGDKGRTLMQTKEEEKLMWSLDKDELCFEDEFFPISADELMDLFLSSDRCDKDQLLRRGWGEKRFEDGLSFRKGLSDDGRSFLMR